MNEYPQHTKDELGRVYITKHSDSVTVVKKYWGNTKKIKMVYNLLGDIKSPRELNIDVLDKEGNIVVSFSNFWGLDIKLTGFKGFKQNERGNIRFPITEENMQSWTKKIKKV
jgi:hypothetical protein